MSSNFLQRFKGKTQQISKDGVQNILGSKKPEAVYNPNQQYRQRNFNSVNNNKPNKSTNSNFLPQKKKAPPIQKAAITATTTAPKKTENPFLVSNPFYLDEQEKQRQEIQKRQRIRLEQQTKKAEKQLQMQKNQNTKTSLVTRSLEKKKNPKEWVKLGGLGANIGGDQWLQKKKKQEKMQQFAGQVKSINANKPPRPEMKKQQPKETNARQKALQYSKNVPKPVVRKNNDKEQEQPQYSPRKQSQNQLTQLQIYQMKHEQLKKMINNNY